MKHIYNFTEGNENMKNLLGIKGARLSELANFNLPIPKGFVISTEVCRCFSERELEGNYGLLMNWIAALK